MHRTLLAAAILLLPSLVFAQPADPPPDSHPNSLRAGVWAFQFDVNGQVFSVESFAGGVSLKRQFSPKWAVRFGVGFDASGLSAERADEDTDFDSDRDAYGATIEAVYQRYLNPGGVVNAYWSLGPLVSARRSTEDETRLDATYEIEQTRWSAGAIASFGVEWFFARQFSLHSEFTGSATYMDQTAERTIRRAGDVTNYERIEDDGWSVGTTDNVRLGLSVYF